MSFTTIMNEAMRLQKEAISKGENSQDAMVNFLNSVNKGLSVMLEPTTEENTDGRA